jgi:hypothetical protein
MKDSKESLIIKTESKRLLEVAKKLVEMAIEEEKDKAINFINQHSNA